ncbi:MAG: site-2 protease family protein [Firmicutes bacterium]|nr:site-2 protease family protein [Candidatus Fermentithermobacillaceae bacterium]
MPESPLLPLVLRVPGFLLGISVHEYAHARMAYALGDDTAHRQGRMTLEPWAHIDPIGALMLIVTGFGWARPVPVDPFRLRSPRRDMAKVAFAGPFANLVTAFILQVITILIFSFLHLRGTYWVYLPDILDTAAWVNASLAFFNLIPIPPLDGWHILELYIPGGAYAVSEFLERYGFVILLLLVASGIVGVIIGPLVTGYMNLCRLAGLYLSFLFRPVRY